ncbi:TraB/GumN family protein [Parasphingorhabdus marina]|uniref:TraB/GumN family protein n=1 Tax=Parasphingorhabdus marina TaxID=394732 RepID=UPI00135655C7|nr:TraB/GumN family protein [Parasphingorhabdus marina]
MTGTSKEQPGTAYLFGTIHTLPKGISWRTELLDQVVSESDELVIEVLGLEDRSNSAKIFSKLATSPDLPAVEARIAPALHDDLDRVLDKSNIPEIALNRMESWAAALSLASAQSSHLGLRSEEGVERKLVQQFTDAGKAIAGLETIEGQLGYFDKLPETDQREMLTTVIEDAGTSKNAFEKLFNAWYSGDIAELEKLTEGGILEKPEIREKILVARNRDWDNQLHARLQKPGTSLVAVGAAHLVGPDSVQLMLEKRGYKVEKIQ